MDEETLDREESAEMKNMLRLFLSMAKHSQSLEELEKQLEDLLAEMD